MPISANITWFRFIVVVIMSVGFCRADRVWLVHSFICTFCVTHAALSSSTSLSLLNTRILHVLRFGMIVLCWWTRIQNECKQIKKEIEQNRTEHSNGMKHERRNGRVCEREREKKMTKNQTSKRRIRRKNRRNKTMKTKKKRTERLPSIHTNTHQ